MYEKRDHAPDSIIGAEIRRLKLRRLDPYAIAYALIDKGYEVRPDGSGMVNIRFGKETCDYPLNVTELPSSADRARVLDI